MRQGLSADSLATGLAAGAVCGVFPILGLSTLLCIAVGTVFRLNHVALQTANYLVYPLQLILLLPLFRAGAALFGIEVPVHNVEEIIAMTRDDIWHALGLFWDVSWRAMIVWVMLAFPTVWVVSRSLRPLLHYLERRISRSKSEDSL